MLNAKNFGLAAGILWGVSMFVLTIVCLLTGFGNAWLQLIQSFYVGYSVSWVGSIIGFVYGFLDGFIGCYLFAWIYNKLNAA